jgi:hypothetical protein
MPRRGTGRARLRVDLSLTLKCPLEVRSVTSPASRQYPMGVKPVIRLPTKAERRGAWGWLLYGFGPTVFIPVVVVILVVGISRKSLTLSVMGGQGEFAFMAVALAAGAQATVMRSAALKPRNPDDPNTLSGFTMLILIASSAVWGYLTGLVNADQSYSTGFASVAGLILLGVAAIVSISVAAADARLMQSATLTVVAEETAASAGGAQQR